MRPEESPKARPPLTAITNRMTNSSTEETAGKARKVVSFGQVHIDEFRSAVGDNPSVMTGGPPIRLHYERGATAKYSVLVGNDRPTKKRGSELILSADVRRERLLQDAQVFGKRAMQSILLQQDQAEVDVRRSQHRRQVSMSSMQPEREDGVLIEGMRKWCKQKLFRGGSKQDPAEAWVADYEAVSAKRTAPRREKKLYC